MKPEHVTARPVQPNVRAALRAYRDQCVISGMGDLALNCWKLWAAVIERAVMDLAPNHKVLGRNIAVSVTEDAAEWLLSESTEPHSLIWVLDVMGLDRKARHAIRAAAKNELIAALASTERRRRNETDQPRGGVANLSRK